MQMLEKNSSASIQESREYEESYKHDTGLAFDLAASKEALHQVLILRQVLQLFGVSLRVF
jgi:hypothetical protein